MPFLQDIIHQFEEGGGIRYVRWGIVALLVLVLTLAYNLRAFRNMGTQEAMDCAQLARNIAEGKGYTTSFIRPFSTTLIKKRNIETGSHGEDPARVKGPHPDIANPPVYPIVLAGLLKVLPLDYTAHRDKWFWSKNGFFYRFQPDFVISLFNQLLFFGLLVMVFFLAKRLFDLTVAWVSTTVLLGTELLWRFCVSGLSTILLMGIFVALIWGLVLVDEEARAQTPRPGRLLLFSVLVGVVVGVGALTRYSFAVLIIPALAYLVLFAGKQRVAATLAAVVAFLAMTTPWVVRNYLVSGTPFGTAGFAFMADHPHPLMFAGNRLERMLEPVFNPLILGTATWHKFLTNLRPILQDDLPRLGGSWVSAFFLVGLLVGFHNESTRKIRYFLLASIPLFIIAQALGKTHLTEASPDLNSENSLVLLTPLVIVYGVSLFMLLLERVQFPAIELRYGSIILFVILTCLPMALVFLPPRTDPLAYPPYDPAAIQVAAAEVKESELTMSDVPWAMAWYGHRASIWHTLRPLPDPKDPTSPENFFTVNDYLRPISMLYLTPLTIDRRFLSQWFQSGNQGWGGFILDILISKRVPSAFPLKNPCDVFEVDPRYDQPEAIRTLAAALNRKISLVDKATQQMLADPELAKAIKESKNSAAFLELTSGRQFPLGRVPMTHERALELMIMRGQLILTVWDRDRLRATSLE